MGQAEDDQRRIEIRNESRHRLRLLELRAARQGNDTPPEVLMEIESTTRELGIADALIAAPVSTAFAAAIGVDNQFAVILHLFDEVRRQQETRAQMTDERFDRVEDTQSERIAAQDEKRKAGQRRTVLVLGMVTIALMINIALTVLVATALRALGG